MLISCAFLARDEHWNQLIYTARRRWFWAYQEFNYPGNNFKNINRNKSCSMASLGAVSRKFIPCKYTCTPISHDHARNRVGRGSGGSPSSSRRCRSAQSNYRLRLSKTSQRRQTRPFLALCPEDTTNWNVHTIVRTAVYNACECTSPLKYRRNDLGTLLSSKPQSHDYKYQNFERKDLHERTTHHLRGYNKW